ncbi:MAG: RpiB/LacA/LacB family sugar-phosphate isomerase, partial [Clostridia bacterium]
QRVLGGGLALDILDPWLNTAFEGGRHIARIEMINNIEKKYSK